jgi:signal transduction histidine kinase/ActR/RegA family two-component response regulator
VKPDAPQSPDDPGPRERELARREAAVRLREEDVQRREAATVALGSHVDELRQANEKLVLATLAADELREQAQLAQRRQDEFLAMLAHELRNPLAPIRMAVETMARSDPAPAVARMLDIIRRQVSHMVRLVDDLLDISRITRGQVVLQKRVLPIDEFVTSAVETCREQMARRRQTLSIDLPRESVHVEGDAVRLSQVVCNILQNASKYTPEGGRIALRASVKGRNVEIVVADNGEGISAATLPHVFDMFVQDERTLGRAQGGLGIGLTVVRQMVELHGGTVEARSDGLGAGSEFIVTLPIVDLSSSERRLPMSAVDLDLTSAAPARILVVEDNPDAGQTLAQLLRDCGHEVDVALDGAGALNLFTRSQPEVVLCDIGLPGMDGYQVASQMRARQHGQPPMLVALTGYGTGPDVARASKAGFDHHLVKPADPQQLLALILAAGRTRA